MGFSPTHATAPSPRRAGRGRSQRCFLHEHGGKTTTCCLRLPPPLRSKGGSMKPLQPGDQVTLLLTVPGGTVEVMATLQYIDPNGTGYPYLVGWKDPPVINNVYWWDSQNHADTPRNGPQHLLPGYRYGYWVRPNQIVDSASHPKGANQSRSQAPAAASPPQEWQRWRDAGRSADQCPCGQLRSTCDYHKDG